MLASARVSVAECIAGVAQSVAHLSCKQVVEGSSPFSSSVSFLGRHASALANCDLLKMRESLVSITV